MGSQAGRANYVSEDVLRDTDDPGAVAVCVWAEAFVSGVLLEL